MSKTYNIPSNFKKHILEPAYPVLKDFNDVWFDLEKNTISKNGKGEHVIEFRVLDKDTAYIDEKRNSQIIDLLTMHFNFTLNDLNEIGDILKSVSKERLVGKLSELIPSLSNVKNKANYVKISLRNEFHL